MIETAVYEAVKEIALVEFEGGQVCENCLNVLCLAGYSPKVYESMESVPQDVPVIIARVGDVKSFLVSEGKNYFVHMLLTGY